MGKWWKKLQNKQYGQALVEFALTLPIFLIVVIGIIELGRFFLVYSSVYTASREAARYGSSVGDTGDIHYQDCDGIKQTAVDSGWFGGVEFQKVFVYYESSPGVEPTESCPYDVPLGYRIVVEVQAKYKPILVEWVLPDGINLSSKNGRTIMKEIEVKATPLPVSICSDDVEFLTEGLQPGKNKFVYIDVSNLSNSANYQLIEVEYAQDNLEGMNYLAGIYWGDEQIWAAKTDVETPITITELNLDTSNLPAGTTKRIEFEYKFSLDPGFAMNFILKFRNAANFANTCDKSIIMIN